MEDAARVASHATILLRRLQADDGAAAEELLPLVYAELRAIAGGMLRDQRPGHTLQPTALVHEAYVKLVGADTDWEGRTHFRAVAAKAMRQILQDYARATLAQKRGGGTPRSPVTTIAAPSDTNAIDLLALNELLERLTSLDEEGARIVELRFFGGLTVKQVAEVTEVPLRSVERSWRRSRAWLEAQMLAGDDPERTA
ncbi:MAG: sigma-70 family RNA polymerase sigma factor [Phycisphaerales bacterium]|nr:sigma-70 family RNA polymerase sigma factor [Phycisphaerales bacterium]